jgi:hypothetical protein
MLMQTRFHVEIMFPFYLFLSRHGGYWAIERAVVEPDLGVNKGRGGYWGQRHGQWIWELDWPHIRLYAADAS